MADITGKTKRAEETHYVSINDGGTQQGNYNNDGAAADDSLAIGAGASASSESGVSIGHGAHAIGGASRVSIGKNAGGYSSNPNGISIGTDARGSGGVAIGFGSISTSEEGVAIGGGQLASHGAQAQVYGVSIGAVTKSGQSGVAIGYARRVPNNAVAVGANNVVGVATGEGSAAIGMDAYGSGADSTALGRLARAKQDGSVAIGHESEADIPAGVAGYDPATAAQSTSTAREWVSNRAAVSVGSMTLSNATERETRQITSLAAGTLDTDAVNVAQLKAAAGAAGSTVQTHFHVNTGDAAQPAGDPATNLGSPDSKSGAQGENSLAAGVGANAKGRGIAIGKDAKARANSLAIGVGATTNKGTNIAIGTGTATGVPTTTHGVGSIAIGSEAQAGVNADTRQTLAIGTKTKATGNQSTAVGSGSVAAGASAVAVGNDDLIEASRTNLDGTVTTTNNGGSVAAKFQDVAGVAMVDAANLYPPTSSAGTASLAFGSTAKADAHLSTALGVAANASGVASTAVGLAAKATLEDATALGAGAVADRASADIDPTNVPYNPATQSPAVGGQELYDLRATVSCVSVGKVVTDPDGNFFRAASRIPQIVNVAPGTRDTDVATVAQLKGLRPRHYLSINYGTDSSTHNYNNDGATGNSAIAIGVRAYAETGYSIALGYDSYANRSDLATPTTTSSTPLASEGAGEVYAPDAAPAAAKTAVTDTASYMRSPLSIGNNSISTPMTRQINNVAAGTLDSDAANVAQVKAAVAAAQAVGAVERKIRVSAVPTITVQADDYSLVAQADNTTVTLPTAAGSLGRIIRIMNQNINYNVTLTQQYRDYQNASQTQLGSGQWVELQSDGTDWFAIGAG